MTSKLEGKAMSAAAKLSSKLEDHGSDEKPKTNGDVGATNGATNGANGTDAEKHQHLDDSDKKDLGPSGVKNPDQHEDHEDGPAGGYDDTPIPRAPPGYTLKFTFHRANNLPMADINSLSSDPYIVATLTTGLPTRHKEDPPLQLRTPTIRRETEPVWDTEWIVANVPASGFKLKCRIYDEDPADHDDRLGNATVIVQGIDESWTGIDNQSYKIKKRMGSKRAYLMRGLAVALQKTKHMGGNLVLSVEVLGKTEVGDDEGGRAYTVGPMWWTKHYSPMLGRLAGRKDEDDNHPAKNKNKAERYNFQANQFQMAGPVPPELYHRFVEFKPFVKRMFTSSGLQGFLLAKALHHQHARVYNFDRTTEFGTFHDAPSVESTRKFLELVHWDKGGRIFTYVLTLDSLFRFTETGKEFGIDFLSKHTMHSDVNVYIAFSGEFFIRRLKHKNKPTPEEHLHNDDELESQLGSRPQTSHSHHPHSPHPPRSSHSAAPSSPPQSPQPASPSSQKSKRKGFFHCHPNDQTSEHPPDHLDGGPPKDEPPTDPRYYQLVIDNDSGTYRPNAKLLPILKKYLQHVLPGLHIVTLDCQADAELQTKMKKEQRERKSKEGEKIFYRQTSHAAGSNTSISSSDLSDLDDMEDEEATKQKDNVWMGIGKDAYQRGKSRGQHWKTIAVGRDKGGNNSRTNTGLSRSSTGDKLNAADAGATKKDGPDGEGAIRPQQKEPQLSDWVGETSRKVNGEDAGKGKEPAAAAAS